MNVIVFSDHKINIRGLMKKNMKHYARLEDQTVLILPLDEELLMKIKTVVTV